MTRSSGSESPASKSLIPSSSRSADDVGPGPADRLRSVLVGRDRLERVEALAVALLDGLAGDGRGDLVAVADGLFPGELLAPVDELRDVQLVLGIDARQRHRGELVDDGEHRRGHEV